MNAKFTTEVEFEDEHGNIEVRTVTTELPPEVAALAEQIYNSATTSHDEAVRLAVAASKQV